MRFFFFFFSSQLVQFSQTLSGPTPTIYNRHKNQFGSSQVFFTFPVQKLHQTINRLVKLSTETSTTSAEDLLITDVSVSKCLRICSRPSTVQAIYRLSTLPSGPARHTERSQLITYLYDVTFYLNEQLK